jgi:hypothetical protein
VLEEAEQHADGELRVDLQLSGPAARPDARFEATGLVVLFENKICEDAVEEDQLRRHLELLGAAPAEHVRVLLAITPDEAPPSWWADFCSACKGGIRAIHGSWTAVHGWAVRVSEAGQKDELGPWFSPGSPGSWSRSGWS